LWNAFHAESAPQSLALLFIRKRVRFFLRHPPARRCSPERSSSTGWAAAMPAQRAATLNRNTPPLEPRTDPTASQHAATNLYSITPRAALL
jgi:hypothetical protein